MIKPSGNASIPSHFEPHADLSSHAEQQPKNGTGRCFSEGKSTWLKRAAGMMTAGLLAADAAYGRALLPPGRSPLGLGGHPRSLLQNCPADQAAMGTANATWLQSAGPYVNAVASNESWIPQTADACPPPYSLALTYAFDADADTLAGSVFTDEGTLDLATQDIIARDFDDITAFVGLIFSPYNNATSGAPNLVVLRNTNANTTIKHWGAEAPGYVGGVTSHLVYTEPAGITSPVERLAGLGYVLGLKSTGIAGIGGLPVGNFGNTALSSVTAPQDNACWPATRLGPLDLAFLAARHGLAPLLSEIEAVALDTTYGTGGLLLSPFGTTMLTATHPGQVTISLVDDGSSATHIGDSVILLAPGSLAGGADASATQGAWIIGNDGENIFTGSDADDFFSPGANHTAITTGLGADSILVNDTLGADISVVDFDPQHDSIWVSPNAANTGAPAMQVTIGDSASGATLQTPGGATVSLLNRTIDDLPALSSWVFSGTPATLAPFKIDLCQGVAGADAPAPVPALSPSAGAPQSAVVPSKASVPMALSDLAPTPTVPAPSPIGPAPSEEASSPAAAAGENANDPSEPEHHHHSNGGVIAGAIIGTGIGIAALGTLGWLFTQRRRLGNNRSQPHNRFERFVNEGRGVEMTGVAFGASPI